MNDVFYIMLSVASQIVCNKPVKHWRQRAAIHKETLSDRITFLENKVKLYEEENKKLKLKLKKTNEKTK